MAKIRASELVYSDIGQWEYDRDNESFVNTQSGFFVSWSEVKKAIGVTEYVLSPKDMVHVLEALEAAAQARAKKEAENAAKPKNRTTIAIDFDGVIHAYSKGWHDGTVYDKPMPGAAEGLQKLMSVFNVYIFSSRDPNQIKTWMKANIPIPTVIVAEQELFWDVPGVIGITQRKLPAIAYIDDRAVTFHNWEELNNGAVKI